MRQAVLGSRGNMIQADVIIPVYKPSEKLIRLLERLKAQTHPAGRIILINTEQKYFDAFIADTDFKERFKDVLVKHISKKEFDHGGTRNYGASLSQAPFFILMTDDAIPADDKMVEQLLKPFGDKKVGMSYARQLAGKGSGDIESYTRIFNYPRESCVKSAENLKTMGIKTFFASNVCAAYRRDIFDELKGFTSHTIFNDDMIYARGLINAGYSIAYAAEAKVEHSHNYSGAGQFRRNFDLGVSHADYPEIFGGLSTESEGIRLVKKTCGYLCRQKKPYLVVKLFWQSGCKYGGYFLGKRYKYLPRKLVYLFSMNKGYWK